MTSEIYPLFSKPVFICNEYLDRKRFDAEIDYVKNLEFRTNENGNLASLDTDILENKELCEIKKIVEFAINEYTKKIMFWAENTFYITQSWANITKPSTSHHKHYHFNSLISGVFYLSTIKEDNIVFFTDDKKTISLESSNYGIFNSTSFKIAINNNSVVVFPSSLIHGVEVNNTDEERISIAFNVFVKGALGSKEKLTYLEI